MILTRDSVELLAPAGNWEALEAAVAAGADAVYLGGKGLNMRLHRKDMNFDDGALAEAAAFAHRHGVRLYVTLNNLISDEELPELDRFLALLKEIKPDAILAQDLAVFAAARRLRLDIPLHASVMMNIHNEPAMLFLKEQGVTRVVAGREMNLYELALLKERTGLEIEYFVHGDMCIAESGQCIHSGVLFGQSSNRGRCLKPCRWPWRLIDEKTGALLDESGPGPYKLALKDMCLYRHLPELIQSGVTSFKIEGRMRPADYVGRIVAAYRKAIDAYIADPSGYSTDEGEWRALLKSRARDFTTNFAFGQASAEAIGFDGSREPRFFSRAKKEAAVSFEAPAEKIEKTLESEGRGKIVVSLDASTAKPENVPSYPSLAVTVANMEQLAAACENGADAVYIGGEAYEPEKPWQLADLRRAMAAAGEYGARLLVKTPRTTRLRECGELEQLFARLEELRPAGLIAGNPGSLFLALNNTDLPLQTDHSFNLFNAAAAGFLKERRVSLGTASLELTLPQLKSLAAASPLPIEVIVQGPCESMISDFNIKELALTGTDAAEISRVNNFALLDEAGEKHSIRLDQYGRSHIFFARDLCLYEYLPELTGIASFRIEGSFYEPGILGRLTRLYRRALNSLADGRRELDFESLRALEKESPRPFGPGAFAFNNSK